jgi:hypothetical protein
LGNNEINGELPSFGSLTNLKVLRLGNNQLYGGIPEELLNGSIPIEELDLSGNGFTGLVILDFSFCDYFLFLIFI